MQRIPIDLIRRFRYTLAFVLLLGGVYVLRKAPQRDFLDEPVGWLLVATSMPFLLYRNYIEVNPAKGRIAHRTGFGYAFIRKRFDIDAIDHIELKSVWRHSSRDDDRREAFAVEVKGKTGGPLCELEYMFPARRVAERVSRTIRVPLENRLFGGSSTRKPEDLDIPLAERWRRANRFKEAPVIGDDSTLVVIHAENRSEISIPAPRFGRNITGVVGFLLVANVVGFSIAFAVSPALPVFLMPPILYATIGVFLRHSGRDRLRFDEKSVRYRRGRLLSTQRMPIDAIEEILEHDDHMVLLGDREHIRIDRPGSESERKLFRQFVERQLFQRQRSASLD